VFIVQRETVGCAAADACQNGVVAVTNREHALLEAGNASRRGPVFARVKVSTLQEDFELSLVLDRQLSPAMLVLEGGWGRRDELLCNLDTEP
jgi:hypothetical protein